MTDGIKKNIKKLLFHIVLLFFSNYYPTVYGMKRKLKKY